MGGYDSAQGAALVRRLRLASGLVLFTYVVTHLLNHSLGLISLSAQEAGRVWFLGLWRNPVGTVLLMGSLLTHLLLALWSLYRRSKLRMPAWEAAQLLLGLAIPPLLVLHALGTRMAHELFAVDDTYTYVQLVIWHFAPESGVRQVVTAIVAWLHGCIGIHFWLRLRPGYRRAVPWLYAPAILLPVLALLGFAGAAREAARLAADPAWLDRVLAGFPDQAEAAVVYAVEEAFLWGYGATLAAVMAARGLRAAWAQRRGVIRITYPAGRVVETVAGPTLLEISRAAGIPHASVCGGRGRCSTCRVHVGAGADRMAPPEADEARVLARVGAPDGVRLACQIRPSHDLTVAPLLPPTATARDAGLSAVHLEGEEREIAILFADLRSFTRVAEQKLPYDVVFLLNRYFAAMGRAVEEAGGRVDKFIGDGVMALFGVDCDAGQACRRALAAARGMAHELDTLNEALAYELEVPLRMGIGIHAGAVIVGAMGYGGATSVTAVGDSVNTASRLEALTKDIGCQLVVSDRVAEYAGVDLSAFRREEVEIRGRSEFLGVRVIAKARDLPEGLDSPPR